MFISYEEHFIKLEEDEQSNFFVNDAMSTAPAWFACQKVYSYASPWIFDSLLVDNETHYISKETRSCVKSNIGTPPGCNATMERYVYYYWIHEQMTIQQAQVECEAFSAKVFDKLDGKESTIAFLANHLKPHETFLIGISDEISENVWLNHENQLMNEYIKFFDDEPNGGTGENWLFATYRNVGTPNAYLKGIADGPVSWVASGACYKITYDPPPNLETG